MSDQKLFAEIVERTRGVIARGADAKISLHEPSFAGNEWKYVKECIDTGWVSSVGKYVDQFEAQLAQITGAGKAVAVVNGTAALQICCQLIGVRRGDEVLMPTFTFIATANAVHHAGGIPHFVDCEDQTFGVDPVRLREHLKATTELRAGHCYNRATGRKISALIVVHLFGHPSQIDALAEVCQEFKIELIEDAAESLGSKYRGKHAGTFAKVAALSFNGNKIVTTGGGGAVLVQDPELGARAKHLTTTAKKAHPWAFQHDEIGYNFRMPNLNAALGCAQLEQLPGFIKRKRELARRYLDAFKGLAGVRILHEPAQTESNYWLNTLLFDRPDPALRDAFLAHAHSAGILARPAWALMHRLPMYADCPRMDLRVAENLEARIVNLPSGSQLGVNP